MKFYDIIRASLIFGYFVQSAGAEVKGKINFDEYEALSLLIKNRDSVVFGDEGTLKVQVQLNRPIRKMNNQTEISESLLSEE